MLLEGNGGDPKIVVGNGTAALHERQPQMSILNGSPKVGVNKLATALKLHERSQILRSMIRINTTTKF